MTSRNILLDQITCKRERRPKRILHFSDGDMVEYSSEDEADTPQAESQIATVNPVSISTTHKRS